MLAAGYVRVSRFRNTDDTAEEMDVSTSPATQRRIIEGYAQAHGHQIAAWYTDLDESGGSLNRPDLARLRQHWQRYDVVIVAKLDRLSRSVVDFDQLRQESEAANCALAAVAEGLDLTTPFGKFTATILAAFAELELATIRLRVLQSKETMRAEGRWDGSRLPWAYKVVNKQPQIDPDRAEVLRAALKARAGGSNYRELQQLFTDSGIPPTLKDRWTTKSIRDTIRHPKMNGTVFTAAEYEQVLRLFAPESGKTAKPATRLLSGIIYCSGCGSPMYVGRSQRSGWTYRCSRRDLPKCPRPVTITSHYVDEYVASEYLGSVAGDRPQTRAVSLLDQAAEERAEIQQRIRTLTESLPALDDDAAEAALAERRKLRQQAVSLTDPAQPALYVIENTGKTVREAWQTGSLDEQRRMLLDELGSTRITIGPGEKGRKGFDPSRITPQPLFPVD